MGSKQRKFERANKSRAVTCRLYLDLWECTGVHLDHESALECTYIMGVHLSALTLWECTSVIEVDS